MKPYDLFAVVQPGLEQIAAHEFDEIGIKFNGLEKGGISFAGHLTTLFKLNILSHCISRILLRMGTFHAENFWTLEKELAKLPWKDFITDQDICLRVTSISSKLYHEKAIAERVINSLNQIFSKAIRIQGRSDSPNTLLILIQVEHDEFKVSIDSSGAHLHKRGYLRYRSLAPIRETLAAGLIKSSGWLSSDRQLLDPMCGSGTIPIEAAVMACHLPLSKYREFSFQKWGIFRDDLFQKVHEEAMNKVIKIATNKLIASDIREDMVTIAVKNAESAGVSDYISFSVQAANYYHQPLAKYHIITNPPYGKRLSMEPQDSIRRIFETLQRNGSIVDIFIPEDEINVWKARKVHFICKNGGISVHAIRI
jgi:putative N6-adenine-specific DNA methylase